MLCALKSAQNAESSLDSAKNAYQNAQKIMQERMLKNLAFFARNKIAKSLQTALNGGNKRFNLYFTQSEINIIDLTNNRFLYPKGAFLSVSQNLAQTPLNNDKWRIYGNNLRLGKIENKTESATIEGINEIVEIGINSSLDVGNSSLTRPSREFEKSSLDGLKSYLRADFSAQPTNLAQDTRIALANNLDSENQAKIAESSDKIKSKKPFKSFYYFWLSPKVESPLPLNPNLPNSADSATRAKNAESTHFYHSKSFSCHSERSEESKNNPSLRADSQNLRGNPPIKKGAESQGGWLLRDARKSYGLPRSHLLARNDENLDSSLCLCSAQNDNMGLDSADSQNLVKNQTRIAESALDSANPTYHLPPLFLPQTNIFGLCGGLFLDILVECGYFFHSLLIYEEDAELFALSCYFVDYERLFSRTSPKSCYIFIENLLDKGLLNHYFYNKKITNNFLRLELSLLKSPKCESFKALTFETYKANARGWGSFEDEMVGLKNTFANAQNAPFLRITSKLQTPICVVGSGPSLESNIDFIRANQDKMLIFSCGTALKVLKKHKIAIDFQIEIERVPYLAEVLQNSNLGDTAILCASLVNPKVLEVAQNTTLFMRGGSAASYIFDDSAASYIFGNTTQEIAPLEFCAPFVGNAGFSLACALSDEVIMCGMDCGFVKGFAKHASGSIYGDESSETPRDCFKVEGNCADFEVFSNAIFSLSKESFALSIAHYKPKIVHNLSLGAKIKGANFTQTLILKNRTKKTPLNSCFVEKTALDSAKKTLKDSALNFIAELKNAINGDDSKPIATKQELFCYIDSITDFLAKISEKNPKIGILFEGSISHLLQSAMIALLGVKKNAIGAEFSACKAVILGALKAYKREIGKLQ